jgi:D-alanine-D-alanine ligase
MKVAVLMGGNSSEREISLRTGRAVAEALRALGHMVAEVDAGPGLAAELYRLDPDAAFIALHGRYGEDGCVQGLCEVLQIPYTGSGVLASALAMDKIFAKRVFRSLGLPVPEGVEGTAADLGKETPVSLGLGLPIVVKPRCEGSSVGVTIVRTEAAYAPAVDLAGKYGRDILVERYVAGREVNVAVLGDKALGAIEIVPATEFYDYQAKYERKDTQYIFPARLDGAVYEAVLDVGLRAHQALECRGVTRSDLIVTPAGEIVLLEVNTLPGMTATSLVPKIARALGMTFESLCNALLAEARLGA